MEHFDVTQTHYLTQLPSKTRKMLEELEKHLGLDSEKVLEKCWRKSDVTTRHMLHNGALLRQ